ncbi:MAG: GNAT family N-acetyltransferase [Pelagibaca sp.]
METVDWFPFFSENWFSCCCCLAWAIWDRTYEAQGYALEAARAYLRHATQVHDFDLMLIHIANENLRSQRLAMKLGAQLDRSACAPSWAPDMKTYRLKLRPDD